MKTIGSQKRETLKEAGYRLLKMSPPDIVVLSAENKMELWTKKDDYAGYVLELNDIGYEFVRTISTLSQKEADACFSG